MPVKFDIATAVVSILGMVAAWLFKGGVSYIANKVAKPRISSSVNRANMQDANAMSSESLVLQAAQMQQTENAELRKEQKEIYTHLVKMATELGKAQGKLEAIQPPAQDLFGSAVMVEALNEKSNPEIEFLSPEERKPHPLLGMKDEHNFGESFQSKARSGKNRASGFDETDY
jgi:hypothetical protein